MVMRVESRRRLGGFLARLGGFLARLVWYQALLMRWCIEVEAPLFLSTLLYYTSNALLRPSRGALHTQGTPHPDGSGTPDSSKQLVLLAKPRGQSAHGVSKRSTLSYCGLLADT